jgi:hypothetical protein
VSSGDMHFSALASFPLPPLLFLGPYTHTHIHEKDESHAPPPHAHIIIRGVRSKGVPGFFSCSVCTCVCVCVCPHAFSIMWRTHKLCVPFFFLSPPLFWHIQARDIHKPHC